MLETGQVSDIIIRNITKSFWLACLDVVNTSWRDRVCAVGSPGIGKTTCTPVLIRMLLEQHHTVLYLVRTPEKVGWYYEFSRSSAGIQTYVFPEDKNIHEMFVRHLVVNSTYLVVEPGKTQDSCDPSYLAEAKVIIVANPDSKHWGGSEFEMVRGRWSGVFKYFPLWELSELLAARPILAPDMSEDMVVERYGKVGGVPRTVFAINSA
jgi:hypothetical protein